jgi:hypothetical protein
MTLYEINAAIMGCVDDETGEIIDFEQLDELQMEREEKLESIALYIKGLEAEAEAIGREREALSKRKAVKENKAKRLREYLAYNLDGQPFETARVALSFRKSTSLKVTDERVLIEWLEQNHDDCLSYKAPTISKSSVATLIKDGEAVSGAELETRNNLNVK